MKYYFNVNGRPWAKEQDVLPESTEDPLVEIPEGIALWRMNYNHENQTLTIQYEGMTDSEAEAQLTIDLASQSPA